MATIASSHIQFVYDKITFDKNKIKDGSLPKIEVESFSLKDFWTEFETAVQGLSNEVTKIGFMCGQAPYPRSCDLEDVIANLLQYYNMMRDLYCVLPKEIGQTLHKLITSAAVGIMGSLQDFVLSLNNLTEQGAIKRLSVTGAVWEACKAVQTLPRDNVEASLKVIDSEKSLASDALEELNTYQEMDVDTPETELNLDDIQESKPEATTRTATEIPMAIKKKKNRGKRKNKINLKMFRPDGTFYRVKVFKDKDKPKEMDVDTPETELNLDDIQESKPEATTRTATEIPMAIKKKKNRGKRKNKINLKMFRPDGTFYRVKVFKDKDKPKEMDVDTPETELNLDDIQESKPEATTRTATEIPMAIKKKKNRGKRKNKINLKMFRPDGTFYRVKVSKDKDKPKVKDICTISTETQNNYCDLDSVKELEELKDSLKRELQELDDNPENKNIADFIDLTVVDEANSQRDVNEKEALPEKSINLKSQECFVQKSKSTLIKSTLTGSTKENFQGYDENKLPFTTLESGTTCWNTMFSENLNDCTNPHTKQNKLSTVEKTEIRNELNKKLMNLQLFKDNMLNTKPKDFDRLVSELTVNEMLGRKYLDGGTVSKEFKDLETSAKSEGMQNEVLRLPVTKISAEKDLFQNKCFEEHDKDTKIAEFKSRKNNNETQPELLDGIVSGLSTRKDMLENELLVGNQAISSKKINASPVKINLLNMQNESLDFHHGNVSSSGDGLFPAKTKNRVSSQVQNISEITTGNGSQLEENKVSGLKESEVVIEHNSVADISDEKTIVKNINLATLVEWVHRRMNIKKSTTYKDICREHKKSEFYISKLGSFTSYRGDQRRQLTKHRNKFAFFSQLLTSHLSMFEYVTCKFTKNPKLINSTILEVHKYFTDEEFKNFCKDMYDGSSNFKENSHLVGVEPVTSGSSVRDDKLDKNVCMSINDHKDSTFYNCGGAENPLPLNSSHFGTITSGGLQASSYKEIEICLPKLKYWVAEKISLNMIPSLSLLFKDINGVENLLRRFDSDKNDLLYTDLSISHKIEKQHELRLKLVNLRLLKHILETHPSVLDRLVSEITPINELRSKKCPEGSNVFTESKYLETFTKNDEIQDETVRMAVSEVSGESKCSIKYDTNAWKGMGFSVENKDYMHMPDESVDCQKINILFISNEDSSNKTECLPNAKAEISELTNSNSKRLEGKKVSELSQSKDIIEINNLATFSDMTTESTDANTSFDDLVKWVHKRLSINKPTTIATISKERKKSGYHILRLGGLVTLKKHQQKELNKHHRKVSFFSTLLTSHLPMFKYIICKFTDNPALIKSSVEEVQKHILRTEFEEYCLNSCHESNRSNTQPKNIIVEDHSPAPGTPQLVDIENNTAAPGTSKVITSNISNGSDQDNNSLAVHVIEPNITNSQQINSSESSGDSRPPNYLIRNFVENWVQKQVIKNLPFTIQELNHEINYLNEYCNSKIKRGYIKNHVRTTVNRKRSLAKLLSFAKQLVEGDPLILEPIGAKYKAKLELIKLNSGQLDAKSLSLFYKWQNTIKKNPPEDIQRKPTGSLDVLGQSNITFQDINSKQVVHVDTNNCITSSINYCNATNVQQNHSNQSVKGFKPRVGNVETKEVSYNLAPTDYADVKESNTSRGITDDDSKNNLKRQNIHIESLLNDTHFFNEGNSPTTHEMSCNREYISPSKRPKIGEFPVKCAPNISVTDVVPLSLAYTMHSNCINNSIQENSVIRDNMESRLTILRQQHFAGYDPKLLKVNSFPNENTDSKTGLIEKSTLSSSLSLKVAKLSQPLEPNFSPYSSPPYTSQLQRMHMFLPTPTVQCCSVEFLQYYPYLKISEVMENMTKRNPGLDCRQWRVNREWKDELNCFNYSLEVDDESVRFLLSQGNRARVTFKYYALFQRI